MKAIYTVLRGKVYKVNQNTDIPNTLTQKTPGVNTTVSTDANTKAVTQFVNINTLETPSTKTNRERYEELVNYLKKEKITNIKSIQNNFKIYVDYTVYEGNEQIERSAVIKPIDPTDMILPLGVATNSETVYRRVKTFEPSVEFKLRRELPFGIMSPKKKQYTLKINDVCIFQDLVCPKEVHNSIYETPYSIGSETLNHNLSGSAMIYSLHNEGIEIQPIRLNFAPSIITVKFDITLCNYIVAYNDVDIEKILLDNINQKYNPDQGEIEVPEDSEDEGTLIPDPEVKPGADGYYNPDKDGFFEYYERCRETTPDALKVVEDLIPDNIYDVNTMVKQNMVVKDIPDIEIGEYVLFVKSFDINHL